MGDAFFHGTSDYATVDQSSILTGRESDDSFGWVGIHIVVSSPLDTFSHWLRLSLDKERQRVIDMTSSILKCNYTLKSSGYCGKMYMIYLKIKIHCDVTECL